MHEISNINIADGVKEVDLELSHVKNLQIREAVEKIVNEYKPEKIRDVQVNMKIILTDDIPVYARPRRLSPIEKQEVDETINEWIADGIVQPSVSDYASPIVPVWKKDGSMRVCVDYQALNQKIVKDRYPLPLIEDQLDLLQDAKWFCTIDLKNGFFHVPIEESSRKFTSFVTPSGQFEFLKVPFGLCNSPSVFQRFIKAVFRNEIIKRSVLTYLDDVIILAANQEEALIKLKGVLNVASKHGLTINWKRCQLLQEKIEYLGHIVENGKLRPSELKTKSVKNFRVPKNVKDVQSFLGLTGYFRKFINKYSLIARPLTNLLKT